MRWVSLLALLGFALLFWKLFPLVQKEKACFDTAGIAINDINYNVVARSWGKEEVCVRRSNVLITLNDCIRTATGSSFLARHTNTIIENAVYLIRPLTKSLTTLENEHNADCSDYPNDQLE